MSIGERIFRLIFNSDKKLRLNFEEHAGDIIYYYSQDNGGNIERVHKMNLKLRQCKVNLVILLAFAS